MLKGINPLLTPDLLYVLAAMGHGDEIALVDGNHPAETVAAETTSGQLIRLPGVAIEDAARAILSVLPLDTFVDDPVRRMEVIGDPDELPDAQLAVKAALKSSESASVQISGLDRFAFYEAAKSSFAVVQVGDFRPYGCFLFKKGVLNP
ncbi:MAG: RbsD/FucU domain-containing protein [Verrucomicrobiales bacterium]|nr:RbsD/FucU domain-containing protein [Verrucomicrobiales bacterium]